MIWRRTDLNLWKRYTFTRPHQVRARQELTREGPFFWLLQKFGYRPESARGVLRKFECSKRCHPLCVARALPPLGQRLGGPAGYYENLDLSRDEPPDDLKIAYAAT